MLKIACIGAHGTGKTTLMTLLEKSLQDKYPVLKIDRVSSVTRELKEQGIEFDRTSSELAQVLSFSNHYQQLVLKSRDCNVLLSDRSVYDDIAYMKCDPELSERTVELLTRLILTSIQDFWDIVFYLPVYHPLEDDNVRSIDLEYQKEVDKAVSLLTFYVRSENTLVHTVKSKLFLKQVEEMLETVEERF